MTVIRKVRAATRARWLTGTTLQLLPLLALVSLAAACLAQGAAQPDKTPDRIDEFIRAEMERQKVPGLAVAIVRKGEILKSKGYGLANVEHRVPVSPETIFQSGSMGKQFTSTAAMLLVEDGKIALDDSIAKYFGEAPREYHAIKVRHLLTHTSGIPDYTGGSIDYRRDYTEEELAKLAFGLPLEFPAGSRWNYSNTGYVLLGILIHRASGSFYGDILRDRVFTPLGMKTARIISEQDIVPNRAAGYRLVNGELKNQAWVSPSLNTTADGALYLSLLDLITWDRALRFKVLLQPESWTQIFQPVKLNSGKSYPYGFGWSISTVAGQVVQEHGGSWQGFKTQIVRYLSDDLSVMVLANLAQAQPERFSAGIVKILAPHLVPPPAKPPETDADPGIVLRLQHLLAATAEGQLSPEDFAYVRAGFFPGTAKRYQEMLQGLGNPQDMKLLERKESGDDTVSRYEITYKDRAFTVVFASAPDGKVSQYSIQRRMP